MGKGDARRPSSVPGDEVRRRWDTAFPRGHLQEVEPEPESVRICMLCKAPKPSGRWCDACDRETDSERVYA